MSPNELCSDTVWTNVLLNFPTPFLLPLAHGTGITSPNITLLLWSHPLTVKPPLHQLPLAFLREPAARGQGKISLFCQQTEGNVMQLNEQ